MTEVTYTIKELVGLGFEARHAAEDGASWLFHEGWAIRADPVLGVHVLVTRVEQMPAGPWVLTDWGQQELARRCPRS